MCGRALYHYTHYLSHACNNPSGDYITHMTLIICYQSAQIVLISLPVSECMILNSTLCLKLELFREGSQGVLESKNHEEKNL